MSQDPTLLFDQDTKDRYQQALKAGLDPTQSLVRATQYQKQKQAATIANLGAQETAADTQAKRLGNGTLGGAFHYALSDPESSANITKLAPLAAGAILAPFSGGLSLAGAAALTGAGTAAAELGRQSLNHEDTNLLEAGKQGLYAGGGTYIGGAIIGKAGNIAGKAIEGTAVGNAANKAGEFLNQDAGGAISKLLGKVIGNNPGGNIVDINSLIQSGHFPQELGAGYSKPNVDLPDNGTINLGTGSSTQKTLPTGNKTLQLPSGGTATTDIQSPSQFKVVWNPATNRAELVDASFTMPGASTSSTLPANPAEAFNAAPSNPSVAPGQPQVLQNPATGENIPASPSAQLPQQPQTTTPQTLPANPAEAFNPAPPRGVEPLPQTAFENPNHVEPSTPSPNRMQKVGNNMRADVNNVQVKASPTGSSKEADLNQMINDTLGVGSPAQKYARMPQKMAELQSQLSDVLGSSEATTSAEDLKAIAQKAIEKAPGFTKVGSEGAKFQEEIAKVNEAIDRYAGEDGMISASDHYQLNRELADQAGKAFDKNSPGWQGADMTPSERANHISWKVSRAQLGANNPEANPILAKEQSLIEGAPGLKSARDKAAEDAIKVLGVKILKTGPAKAAVKDAIGAGLQNVGSEVSKAKTPGINPLNLLATSDTLNKTLDTSPAAPSGLPANPADAFNTSGPSTDNGSNAQTNPLADPRFIQYLTLLDMQKTGGKNLDTINKLSDMFAPKALSTADQTRHDSLQTALQGIDAAEQNLITAGGAQGIMGHLANIPFFGQYLNHTGAAYTATKIELATQLAKAITGGSRPAESVIQAYLHSLPDVSDTPEFAADKIKKLRNDLLVQAKGNSFKDIVETYQ